MKVFKPKLHREQPMKKCYRGTIKRLQVRTNSSPGRGKSKASDLLLHISLIFYALNEHYISIPLLEFLMT